MLPDFDKNKLGKGLEESSFISALIGWLVIPFIPLYLTLPYPVLFYSFLIGYLVLFLVVNSRIMHYSLTEVCVFLLFFLFCVFVVKSLFDYEAIDGKEIVKNGMIFGIL